MCEIVRHALQQAFSLLEGPYDDKTFRQVQALEKKADHYEDHLGSYLVRLSRCELSEEDGRRVSILLHSIGDLERMSDHAVELAQSAREIAEKKLSFSAAAKQELQVLTAALRDMITRTASAFIASDLPLAATVEPLEQVIDELNARIKKNHIERLKSGVCTMEMGFILSDISTGCERIADHCSNIAVCQIQVHRGSLDTHRYRSGIQHTDGFDEAKAAFARRYPLP
jgi:phosphate:Na+ symporter